MVVTFSLKVTKVTKFFGIFFHR